MNLEKLKKYFKSLNLSSLHGCIKLFPEPLFIIVAVIVSQRSFVLTAEDPTRDDHSGTIYSQWKVFMLAGWDYVQIFGPKYILEHLDPGAFKGKNHIPLFHSTAAERGLHR